MKNFAYVGKLPASKAILSRLLTAQSFRPQPVFNGENGAEDVEVMRTSLLALGRGQNLSAGRSHAWLRFLALRASRQPGKWLIQGDPRVFTSVDEALIKVLRQVGVRCDWTPQALHLEGSGWQMHGDTILLPNEPESELASALLFNTWNLPFDAYVSFGGRRVRDGQWRMSVGLAQELGMKIDFWDSDFRVSRSQQPQVDGYRAEIDLTAAFALSAVAAVAGQVTLLDFPENSLQPEGQFLPILQSMGVPLSLSQGSLKVEKAKHLNGVVVNLKGYPGLFAGVAALCALAEGKSEILGLPGNSHPEMAAMFEVLQRLGRPIERKPDGLIVRGERPMPKAEAVDFDCLDEPGLAFAAAVFIGAGFRLRIEGHEVTRQIFPGFWQTLGLDNSLPSF